MAYGTDRANRPTLLEKRLFPFVFGLSADPQFLAQLLERFDSTSRTHRKLSLLVHHIGFIPRHGSIPFRSNHGLNVVLMS